MNWVLMVLLFAGGADPTPTISLGDQILLRMPSAIFEDPGLSDHLLSGLTTTFQLAWAREKNKPLGAMRLDIRYEPWDEVFFLAIHGSDGSKQALRFPTQTDLITWWRGHPFEIFGLETLKQPPHLWVTLRIIPFSQAEQKMAREWLTPQNNQPDSGLFSGRTGSNRSSEQQPQNNLLRIMFATSIQREAIKSYRWKIKIP